MEAAEAAPAETILVEPAAPSSNVQSEQAPTATQQGLLGASPAVFAVLIICIAIFVAYLVANGRLAAAWAAATGSGSSATTTPPLPAVTTPALPDMQNAGGGSWAAMQPAAQNTLLGSNFQQQILAELDQASQSPSGINVPAFS